MSKRTVWICDKDGEKLICNSGNMPSGWVNTPFGDLCLKCCDEVFAPLKNSEGKKALADIDAKEGMSGDGVV